MCYRELALPRKLEDDDRQIPLIVLLVIISFAAVIQLIGIGNNLHSIGKVTDWVGSFAAGAVIALLTGRLESKLINPPLVITVALYLYAVIQATLVLFPNDAELMIAMTSVAFLFKVILFLLITWLLGSGVLIFYLAESDVLHQATPHKRKEFVEAFQSKKLD
jgi:hypothetical protein